jgi:hypothetical protein
MGKSETLPEHKVKAKRFGGYDSNGKALAMQALKTLSSTSVPLQQNKGAESTVQVVEC